MTPRAFKDSAVPGFLVMGDLSSQGNIEGVRPLLEPLQLGMDNGAKKALIPIENRRDFLEGGADVVERVDPRICGDPKAAAMKTFGVN